MSMKLSVILTSMDINFYLQFFYAPWCGHSKNLKDEYNKFADSIKNDKTLKNKVLITAIDCTKQENKELCEKFHIQGYPSIFYLDASNLPHIEAHHYHEARTSEGFHHALKELIDNKHQANKAKPKKTTKKTLNKEDAQPKHTTKKNKRSKRRSTKT
jgi:thiol-disulfide isomerase/thioredoxin